MYDFQCFTDDFVEIGGASNLDPTLMEVKESFCGHQPAPAKMVRDKTIFLHSMGGATALCVAFYDMCSSLS